MKTYTSEQIKEIIENHQKWLNNEHGGTCADLSDADLTDADLTGATLIRANLTDADLTDANLTDANLYCANLTGATLIRANLTDADLTDATLIRANLTGATLIRADLTCANLIRADLADANLTEVRLWDTIGNAEEIKSLQTFEEYNITYTKTILQIGCKNYPFEDWWNFSDKKIITMDGKKALRFWNKNKEMIKMFVESNPAK